MKFPRNARIIRSHFDVAPFAAVFFVLLIFLMISALLPTPGIPLQPPSADDLPGTAQHALAMAVDADGNFYYQNRIVTEQVLSNSLAAETRKSQEPMTLVIHADKAVRYETLAQLSMLARQCGLTNELLATLPSVENAKP